ncbi:MAG: nucleotidyltransferase domain-containing protein [Chloroflexi bacterium]|nr:nucleotidyltransferase domain-containing protein [Chloroflexota bacterium]
MTFSTLLSHLTTWAEQQPDITGVLLVGSYARGTARPDSDVDLVVLTTQPQRYLNSISFAEQFGAISKWQKEAWGKVTSIRVWYRDGLEIEFGITQPAWAKHPLDAGTRQVISDGMQIVFDRVGSLNWLAELDRPA